MELEIVIENDVAPQNVVS